MDHFQGHRKFVTSKLIVPKIGHFESDRFEVFEVIQFLLINLRSDVIFEATFFLRNRFLSEQFSK